MNRMVKRLLCIASLILFNAAGSYSESTDWTAVHDLTVSGIRQLYSLEVDSAIQTFDAVSRIAPGDPRGPFFQSVTHFYLYSLNRNEKELASFFDGSERVIEICELLLDQNEQDAKTKFYLGGIYGYRGLAYQASGSILKAARDGRKGYMLLEEAVVENPKLYDAHMGFGLFRYLLAKVPKSMKWILTLLGIDGDLEGGLTSLRLASEKGIYTRTEAKLFLSQFLFAEGRQDSAMRYLNELRTEYPENTLFMVLYAAWQHRLHNLDEAMTAARAAIDLNNRKKIRYGEELAYSTIGSVYYTLNDFANARTYYLLYMQLTRNNERTLNQVNLRGGLVCEIMGDRATALEFYRRVREPDAQSSFWDQNNYRRAQELLQRPLAEAEILIVKAGNESSQKNHAHAVELFKEGFQKAGANADIQARALYGLQQAQFDADSLAEAIATANQLLALKPVNEVWITPHAWFKLGQTYAKQSRIADARAAFSRVDDYDDYDFQERLEGQVKEEMKKIER
jgi:tetratricopeptide (TPR) repeat protein